MVEVNTTFPAAPGSTMPSKAIETTPPYVLSKVLIQDLFALLSRIKEKDISAGELLDLSKNLLEVDPWSLISERKRDKIVRAQVDILKYLRDYSHKYEQLRNNVLDPSRDLSDSFREQQSFLPIYAREVVSFSHLAAQYASERGF